jgi:hypothetical protein
MHLGKSLVAVTLKQAYSSRGRLVLDEPTLAEYTKIDLIAADRGLKRIASSLYDL